jgi:AraC-like DNA-binding protein
MITAESRQLFTSPLLRIEAYDCAGHSHAEEEAASRHEIVFLRRGLFERADSGGRTLADATQALFFNKGQPYRITHPVEGGDRCVIFGLRPAALADLLGTIDPAAGQSERPFRASARLIDPRLQMWQVHIAQAAHQIGDSNPLMIEESSMRLISAVLGGSSSRERQSRPRTEQAHAEIVHQTRLVLGRRYTEKLSLEQIARTVHTSPFHLARIFRRLTGLPIHRYLHRLRLLAALDSAADRFPSLATLALDSGFASHSHLSSAFRAEFGLSPSQFRLADTTQAIQEMSKILKA